MAVFRKHSKIVLEIRGRRLKILRSFEGQSVISKQDMLSLEIPAETPQDAGRKIKTFLNSNGIKPDETILVIPRQNVTTKILNLPSRDPVELGEMAVLQAIRQIPYSKEDIISGVVPIETAPDGFTKVMHVICHKDMVERPVEIIKGAGLVLSEVTLSSCGLFNRFAGSRSSVILIDCDEDNTEVVAIHDGKFVYSRGFTFGFKEQGYSEEKLGNELRKTLLALGKDIPGFKPELAVFTGVTSGITDFVRAFSEGTGIKTEVSDEGDGSLSFSALMGAVHGPCRVDLMSDEIRNVRKTKAGNREKVVSAVLTISIIAVLSLLLNGRIKREEAMLLSVQDRLKEIGPVAEKLERMKTAVDIKDMQSDKNKIALDALGEIYRITPQSVSINVYKFDGKSIEIKGSAKVLSEVFKYVKSIEDSKIFQNAKVEYATKRRAGDRECVDYGISCSIDNNTGIAKQ